MRHFDAWLLRDPYSIFHYYPTGRRWPEAVRELIHDRQICSPPSSSSNNNNDNDNASPSPSIPAMDPSAARASQPLSPFFTRLPPEIRLMIYAHVFDAPTIHLVQIRNQIRHVRCAAPAPLDQHRQCCPTTIARWRNSSNSGVPKTTPLQPQPQPQPQPHHQNNHNHNQHQHQHQKLYPHTHPSLPSTLSTLTPSLLTTCRAIYTEALPLLYTTPTFDTDDLHALLSFLAMLSPTARASLKHLTVQFSPVWQPLSGQENAVSVYAHTHNDALWTRVWAAVARCKGLEELQLGLDLGSVSGNGLGGVLGGGLLEFGRGAGWVKPLVGVRGLKAFELGVRVRVDRAARRVLEGDGEGGGGGEGKLGGLVRDVRALREWLGGRMCEGRRGEDEDVDV
ncbi:hypothetical protein BO71DRAFT_302605, partial [Aspergillus ellipticus CBS 707.79]